MSSSLLKLQIGPLRSPEENRISLLLGEPLSELLARYEASSRMFIWFIPVHFQQAWAIGCCALCELPLYFDMGVVSAASPTDRVWDRVGCEEAEFLLADAAKSAGGRGHLSYAL